MKLFEIKHWCKRLEEDYSRRPNFYDATSLEILDRIFEKLRCIQSPPGTDNLKQLFLRAEKGTQEEYRTFLLSHAPAVPSQEDLEEIEWEVEQFDDCFPDYMTWIPFSCNEYVDPDARVFRGASLFHCPVLRIDPNYEAGYEFYQMDITPFLSWLEEAVDEALYKLKNGLYNMEVFRELPYEHRTGKLRRSVYWDIFPKEKAEYLRLLTEEDIKEFTSMVAYHDTYTPEDRLPKMNKSDYLRFCGILYRGGHCRGTEAYNSGIDWELSDWDGDSHDDSDGPRTPGNPVSDWDLFCQNSCSHGYGDGLRELADTQEAFDEWLEQNIHHEFDWGGHRWAVINGSSRSRVMLSVSKDEGGYYLVLSGGTLYSTPLVARAFLDLTHAGVPVKLLDAAVMSRKLRGNDYIGIVPDGICPVHRYGDFPDDRVLSFINLDYLFEETPLQKRERILCEAIWYAPGYVQRTIESF